MDKSSDVSFGDNLNGAVEINHEVFKTERLGKAVSLFDGTFILPSKNHAFDERNHITKYF